MIVSIQLNDTIYLFKIKENYIKDTVIYFKNQIDEKGFIRYEDLKEERGEEMKIDIKKLEILQARECMTAKELKEKSDISHGTYLRIINGSDKVAPLTVGKLAKALNCDVVELLAD